MSVSRSPVRPLRLALYMRCPSCRRRSLIGDGVRWCPRCGADNADAWAACNEPGLGPRSTIDAEFWERFDTSGFGE